MKKLILILFVLFSFNCYAGMISMATPVIKKYPADSVVISIKVPVKKIDNVIVPDVPETVSKLFNYVITYDNEDSPKQSTYAIITGVMIKSNYDKLTATISSLTVKEKAKVSTIYTKSAIVDTTSKKYKYYNDNVSNSVKQIEVKQVVK